MAQTNVADMIQIWENSKKDSHCNSFVKSTYFLSFQWCFSFLKNFFFRCNFHVIQRMSRSIKMLPNHFICVCSHLRFMFWKSVRLPNLIGHGNIFKFQKAKGYTTAGYGENLIELNKFLKTFQKPNFSILEMLGHWSLCHTSSLTEVDE